MRSLWLDTDPGFDDLVTWLLLERLPGYRLDGVSVVAGNAPLTHTLANARRVSHFLGSAAPIYAGSASPLVGGAPITSQHLLGETGLSSAGRPLPDIQVKVQPEHAVDALVSHLRATPATTLVAIAPLTNVALALQQAPDLAGKLERIVMMGGSTDRGNHTAAAEFNVYADPEAAEVVLESGVPLTMLGLNLTRQVLVGGTQLNWLRTVPGERAAILADHLAFYLVIRDPGLAAPMPFHDPVTAIFLAHPELFMTQPARIDIELIGRHTRGMTVCEFRPHRVAPNAEVVTQARGQSVIASVMEELTAFCYS